MYAYAEHFTALSIFYLCPRVFTINIFAYQSYASHEEIDWFRTNCNQSKLCLDWRTAPVEKQESGLDPYQNNSTLLYSGSYSKNK